MSWRKKGVVWVPDGSSTWAKTHATCPTPLLLNDGRVRVFFQSRDGSNVGRIGAFDLDPDKPLQAFNVSQRPVLDIGVPGTFDDSGVFQCSVVSPEPGLVYLYYAGFELLKTVRYRLLTGLAISEDGGNSFKRHSSMPILERSIAEPNFRCGPSVIFADGRFCMWYVAGDCWEEIGGKPMPVYSIKYLESRDGIEWGDQGRLIRAPSPEEHGFGRPLVYQINAGRWEMLFSVRSRTKGYRMRRAYSDDRVVWRDLPGNSVPDISEIGPDSETVEFGAYLPGREQKTMFYNGNDFGATGILLAEAI